MTERQYVTGREWERVAHITQFTVVLALLLNLNRQKCLILRIKTHTISCLEVINYLCYDKQQFLTISPPFKMSNEDMKTYCNFQNFLTSLNRPFIKTKQQKHQSVTQSDNLCLCVSKHIKNYCPHLHINNTHLLFSNLDQQVLVR